MLRTELESKRKEETFDWAYVDISGVQPLRVGNPQYDGVRTMLEDLPRGKAIYMALPEGEDISKFSSRIREILNVWPKTSKFGWSVRRDKRGRGIYILKAVQRNERFEEFVPMTNHPEPLTNKQKKNAVKVVLPPREETQDSNEIA